LQFVLGKATIKAVLLGGRAMPKKPTAKAKFTEAEPFGPGFVELSTEAFQEAVAEVWDRQKQKGQDSYGTIDGELVAVKPDGRVEPVTFNAKATKG
jgi:hypothetical protein